MQKQKENTPRKDLLKRYGLLLHLSNITHLSIAKCVNQCLKLGLVLIVDLY